MNNIQLLTTTGLIFLIIVVIMLLVKYESFEHFATDVLKKQNPNYDNVSSHTPQGVSIDQNDQYQPQMAPAPIPYNENVLAYPQQSNPYETLGNAPPISCAQKPMLNPNDLLPIKKEKLAFTDLDEDHRSLLSCIGEELTTI